MMKNMAMAMTALVLSASVFAASEGTASVELRGFLNEDAQGFFLKADGKTYDLDFRNGDLKDQAKAMAREEVVINGALKIEDATDGKQRLIVEPNRIARLAAENVKYETTTIVREQPLVRERVIRERHHHDGGHLRLPFVDIGW